MFLKFLIKNKNYLFSKELFIFFWIFHIIFSFSYFSVVFSCQVLLYTYSWVNLLPKHHLKMEIGVKVWTSIRMAAFLYDGLTLDAKNCHRQNYPCQIGSGDNKSFLFLHTIMKLSVLYYNWWMERTLIVKWAKDFAGTPL